MITKSKRLRETEMDDIRLEEVISKIQSNVIRINKLERVRNRAVMILV